MEVDIKALEIEQNPSETWSPIPNPNLHIICNDLLPQILSGVETRDLIRFRLVSKFWKIWSDRILLKRRDHKLVFEYLYFRKKRQGLKNIFVLKQGKEKQSESESEDEDEGDFIWDSDSDSEEILGEKAEQEQEQEKLKFKVVEETERTLSRFLSLFSPTSSSFPCVRFSFIGRKFHKEDVLAFFSKWGGGIKHLDLEWNPRENRGVGVGCERVRPEKWTTHRTLIELFCLNKLTQLETLNISGGFSEIATHTHVKTEALENISQFRNSLPFLSVLSVETIFDYGETRRIIQTLLSTGAAPNLHKIYLPKEVQPHKVLPFFNPKEIQHFSFKGFRVDLFSRNFSMEMLQQIDQLCPNDNINGLEHLWLMVNVPPKSREMAERAQKSLGSLLVKSRESLKSVVMGYAGFIFMMNSVFSYSFKNVRRLSFREWDDPLDQVLPLEYVPLRLQVQKSLSLKNSFPCLESVSLSWLEDNLERWFPFAVEKLETVKRLYINMMQKDMTAASKLYAVKVLETFPNLEHLQLWRIFDFPYFSKCIWKMERLVTLDLLIHIGIRKDTEANHFPNLDSAFTGFSAETVGRILGGNFEQESDLDIFQKFRENSSILDLKDLRLLKLIFDDGGGPINSYNFITRVTRDFAFKRMKRVQIKIKITPPEDLGPWENSEFEVGSLDNVTVKLGWP